MDEGAQTCVTRGKTNENSSHGHQESHPVMLLKSKERVSSV